MDQIFIFERVYSSYEGTWETPLFASTDKAYLDGLVTMTENIFGQHDFLEKDIPAMRELLEDIDPGSKDDSLEGLHYRVTTLEVRNG